MKVLNSVVATVKYMLLGPVSILVIPLFFTILARVPHHSKRTALNDKNVSVKRISFFKQKSKALFILVLFFVQAGFAQLEFSKWYFGWGAGLDFSTTPPTIINSTYSPGSDAAVVCSASGNLQLVVAINGIYNGGFAPIANGNGMYSQNVIAVKQPGNNSNYFVFSVLGGNSSTPGAGLLYNVVDMSLAAGQGSVTVLNQTVYVSTCTKQVAVRHCNGRDIWIVTHEYNSNNFRAYILTSSGLNLTPVISAVGETPGGNSSNSVLGYMAVSPDGKKIATTTYSSSVPVSLGQGGVHLFDFDAATGLVSNSVVLTNQSKMGSVEFSPDGTKLYATRIASVSGANGEVYQWNVCATGGSAAIIASQYSISLPAYTAGTITKAINGKLYFATSTNTAITYSLSVINNPNASGVAMNFSLNSQSTGTGYVAGGLVSHPVNEYTRPAPIVFANTVSCQQVNFAPVLPTFSAGCSSTPYPPGSYSWNFGDPASGSANTSTLASPQHSYALGTYTASLIMYNPCGNDTVSKVITISSPDPSLTVSGQFTVCNGDRRPYTASGGSTYNWSNNGSGATVNLSPTTTTVYNVTTTTSAGCTATKAFTITVNPCLGLSGNEAQAPARVFPNPFNETFTLESANEGEVEISDLEGRVVYKAKINEGQNQINTAPLSKGIYTLKLSSKGSEWRGKMVKAE